MNAIVIDTPEGIRLAQMSALKYALKLEIMGMKRHGRSAYSIIKEEWGLKGSKEKVYEQFVKILARNTLLYHIFEGSPEARTLDGSRTE